LANVKSTIKVGKERIVPTRAIQDIERMVNSLTAGKNMTVSNYTERRDFNATSDTLGDLANAFATLVSDLKKKGIIQ